MSTLFELYLSSNNLQGSIPAELGRLTNLRMLDLLFNRLSGEIPPSIFNLSMLYAFGLGDNNFSGSLPVYFGEKLPNLVDVSLYNNHFEGPIPSSINNATGIQLLLLSNNSFTGVVPNSIGSLYQLESLQLASNRFEATRPEDWDFLASLANCTRLVELDLWENNFSGSLPASICSAHGCQVLGIEDGIGYRSGLLHLVDFSKSHVPFRNSASNIWTTRRRWG